MSADETKVRAPTRADVARLAGVSTAVVSYVVNGGPRTVAPSTRLRVLNAIKQLNYRPNPSARALKRGSTHMLGLLVTEVLNPFFAEYIDALDEAASKLDRFLVLSVTREVPDHEAQAVTSLVNQGVDGLIFLCHVQDQRLYQAGGAGMARVMLDRNAPMDGFSSVGADSEEGAAMGTDHLIERGHRNIGLITGAMRRHNNDMRSVGWARELAAAGLPLSEPVVTTWTREGGYLGAKQLFERDEPPTAIMAGSDLIAIGVLQAAHEAGMDIPRDLAVVSFDGTSESAFSWPPLTTVRQPFEQMAEAAIQVLLDGSEAPRHQSFPMELIVRESSGPAVPSP
ncbi:LacI family DNA-binding transcriptional regulator [Propionibacterium freudenreichii]|uniref:LacI family DNA-binding transcriptional regulator n=1 Tax=Propionibacterium freudenreichii TaxID=1744 RepID=UPI00070BD00D|nr:LacI family DNA-binding transcriptional regulator [Propionibacterium freudenreichii]MDK9676395.1 LacI family DNA-binding transcriptional regulator [Propionibacterium freudenreichii]